MWWKCIKSKLFESGAKPLHFPAGTECGDQEDRKKVSAPLFDRNVSPIQLTDCGKEYVRTTEKILYFLHL